MDQIKKYKWFLVAAVAVVAYFVFFRKKASTGAIGDPGNDPQLSAEFDKLNPQVQS